MLYLIGSIYKGSVQNGKFYKTGFLILFMRVFWVIALILLVLLGVTLSGCTSICVEKCKIEHYFCSDANQGNCAPASAGPRYGHNGLIRTCDPTCGEKYLSCRVDCEMPY